ncbi:CIC11C00000004860 [Sungouiella intermedia]|uniref:ATP-dependent RNA helicase SUV3, mitochondrial n=1 Tax=Sungouiella intermedia TaxID=45354 RepID=A0A1L0DLM6_9ASCO|nr:CIC11C00000004860 [[Candida] intermedia]
MARTSYMAFRLRLFSTFHYCSNQSSSATDVVASARSSVNGIALIKNEQTPFDQLATFTSASLESIRAKLHQNKFVYPYNALNDLDTDAADALVDDFQSALMDKYNGFLNSKTPQFDQLTNITIADYLRPRLVNASPMLYLVYLNRYPDHLAQLKGYKSKQDILEALLISLLYLHHSRRILQALPESDKTDINWDIGNPAEWYPQARKMKRKIIMHVGPTNSGKTYNSLKAFAAAKSGYYAGPLRLLAREIFEKYQSQGISCNLITGEEVIPSLDEFGNVTNLSSGTIEMIPLHKKMDVCIIDEIQMIADEMRGSAWTNAVLGVQAKELHLCGEESAVSLIKELVKATGDELLVKRYNRLGKLTVCQDPVGNFKRLQSGDCVITFSKKKILELKCRIEQETSYKVGVIYGALPPEIRSRESAKFNNGEYDVLVASDAIGMGLNLKIKRIVFWSTTKFNGTEMVDLSISATKQIAGRAGRYNPNGGELEGFVTAFNRKDLKYIQKTLRKPIADIKKACIWPPTEFWIHYMSSFRLPIPLVEAVWRFEGEVLKIKMKNYFLSEFEHQSQILNLLVKNNFHETMTIEDQVKLALVPMNLNFVAPVVVETALKFFECILTCESKTVFDFNFLHTTLLESDLTLATSYERAFSTLEALETNHKLVLVFMWLSQRWPTLFIDKESALDIKTLIEKRISEELLCLRRVAKRDRRGGRPLKKR